MAITARQFTFIAVRLMAAYFGFVCALNLPLYFLTQVTIPPDDPLLMRDALLSVLVWSIGPIIVVLLWRHTDRFAAFILRRVPGPAAAVTHHPWEQSAIALFGAFILIDLLPIVRTTRSPTRNGLIDLQRVRHSRRSLAKLSCLRKQRAMRVS